MKLRLLALLLLFSASLLSAQDEDALHYTIQLGAFTGPKKEDFKALGNIGHVYGIPANNGLTRVFLGGYSKRTDADNSLNMVKGKGYKDAFIKSHFLHADDKIYTIQLSSFNYDDNIDWRLWESFGELYMRIDNNQLRLSSGLYNEQISAEDALLEIRQGGYNDAFISHINYKLLHEMTDFEKGFNSLQIKKTQNRLSVSVLQDIMLRAKYYEGFADGVVNKNTHSAMTMFKSNNYRYQAYKILAHQNTMNESKSGLQDAINLIGQDPRKAEKALKAYRQEPMSMVYRAYLYYTGKVYIENQMVVINDLMNSALSKGFQGFTKPNRVNLNVRHNYQSLDMLILHLRVIMEAAKTGNEAPCWLFENHPKETATAFAPYWNSSRDKYRKSNDCDGFMNIEELKILARIARDFDPLDEAEKGTGRFAKAQELKDKRSAFFLKPRTLTSAEVNKYQNWYNDFWNTMFAWEKKDALHTKMTQVFSFSYHESMYALENHFIEKKFSTKDATSMSLWVLYNVLNYHMKSYY